LGRKIIMAADGSATFTRTLRPIASPPTTSWPRLVGTNPSEAINDEHHDCAFHLYTAFALFPAVFVFNQTIRSVHTFRNPGVRHSDTLVAFYSAASKTAVITALFTEVYKCTKQ
jgi:hypothetical protein